jgi:3-oxoacyl-[acyl-carrier-protein] synthase II
VLPREEIGCRPFDESRDGFLVSEAAAAVVLSRVDDWSKERWARIDRVALGGDATHLTGSDPNGATLRRMIRNVVAGDPVDLVHAHATGTVANDPIELAAYEAECGGAKHAPAIYSHKGALGHSLGAAGLVSVVLNCIAQREGVVPGNVRTTEPLPAQRIIISNEPLKKRIRRSVAVAAGFGGAMAAISLETP